MQNPDTIFIDNGGQRSGIDRRLFPHLIHIPERRIVMDRRTGFDRRIRQNSNDTGKIERRDIIDFGQARLLRR